MTPELAIFVGGKSRRMGEPKGLLLLPGGRQTIVEALIDRGREAGFEPVLVGDAEPYEGLAADVPRIADDPPGAGPLGGLHAVLAHAVTQGRRSVVAIACDMPHVEVETLIVLRDHPSNAAVLAPRRGPEAPWEPMLARYDASRMVTVVREVIASGRTSFQELFSEVTVWPLDVSPVIERALEDWDTPVDVVQ